MKKLEIMKTRRKALEQRKAAVKERQDLLKRLQRSFAIECGSLA